MFFCMVSPLPSKPFLLYCWLCGNNEVYSKLPQDPVQWLTVTHIVALLLDVVWAALFGPAQLVFAGFGQLHIFLHSPWTSH